MKIAAAQIDVRLGEPGANLERMLSILQETASAGAKLTIFPECALTGYCFENADEGRPFAETIPGPATEQFQRACAELGVFALFGMLEADGGKLFNAAPLVGPNGVIGSYRKVHLPFLGIDMHTNYGDRPFAVHEAGELKVGTLICYDAAFPEAARSLALLGADLITLPTNWPPGADCMSDHVAAARAMENTVYFAGVNRVGTERGFTFIGKSILCAPNGDILARGSADQEEILYADIDVERSRRKHIQRVPGKFELDRIADRRPEFYGLLTEPHNLKSPGRG